MEGRTRRRASEDRRWLESKILPNDTMPEVAKNVLRVHFRKMLENEKGVRKGEDMEKLHDMRVAVRRMRTASRIFGDFLDSEEFGRFNRALKTLGRTMGPVRDMDIWIANALSFRETLPLRAGLDLDGVIRDWQADREKLRVRMLAYMASPRYRRFRRNFPTFLDDPEIGVRVAQDSGGQIRPLTLRQLGPVILYGRLAAVRAYEGWLEADEIPLRRYHRFRIEVKRLRYALEFLTDITGPEAEPLIGSLKRVQDHLGDLRETWMASDRLEAVLKSNADGNKNSGQHPGIAAYLASRRDHFESLFESFPSVWATIRNPEFNRRFAALVAAF